MNNFKEEKVTDQLGHWVSILDYAHLKGKSISTIRRSIKANHIKFKLEDGKYFIYCQQTTSSKNDQSEIDQLKLKIEKLSEENDELKMLIKIYEEKLQFTFNFQELPELPIELNPL
jgi:TolA-binding protein